MGSDGQGSPSPGPGPSLPKALCYPSGSAQHAFLRGACSLLCPLFPPPVLTGAACAPQPRLKGHSPPLVTGGAPSVRPAPAQRRARRGLNGTRPARCLAAAITPPVPKRHARLCFPPRPYTELPVRALCLSFILTITVKPIGTCSAPRAFAPRAPAPQAAASAARSPEGTTGDARSRPAPRCPRSVKEAGNLHVGDVAVFHAQ